MGLLTSLLRPRAQYGDGADFWYQPLGQASAAGVRVDADTALKASAVYSCVSLIAEIIAALPLNVYRRRADGGRELATQHPLYDLLHVQPNAQQTAYEFKQMLQAHMLLRGNGYAQIVPGRRGAVDQLVPLHPDRVTVEPLAGGGLRYQVRQPDGAQRAFNDEDIFHVKGFTLDGVTGVSVIEYARESVGLALATESHGARMFGQGATFTGILKHPGKLSKEAAERLGREFAAASTGLSASGKTVVLEEGLDWQQISMTADDAQFLATREFQVADVARWFRVPLHMIGETAKATSWGSGIEQLGIGFVVYTLLPWLKRWEQAIARDLIVAVDTYYAEYVVDALLRGDTKARYEAYAIGRNGGWLSANDVRRLENMNPIPGGDGYLQPLNMAPLGSAPPERAAGGRPPADPVDDAAALAAEAFVRDAAARVLRKETARLAWIAKRTASSRTDWLEAVGAFYDEHAAYVAEQMHIRRDAAQAYVDAQLEAVRVGGAATIQAWENDDEPEPIGRLLALAKGA